MQQRVTFSSVFVQTKSKRAKKKWGTKNMVRLRKNHFTVFLEKIKQKKFFFCLFSFLLENKCISLNGMKKSSQKYNVFTNNLHK